MISMARELVLGVVLAVYNVQASESSLARERPELWQKNSSCKVHQGFSGR